MKKAYVFSLFALLFLSSTIAQFDFAVAEKIPEKHAPDRLLVKFKPGTSKNNQDEIFKQNGVSVADEISQIDVKILKVAEPSLEKVHAALSKHTSVEYVEKDWIFEPAAIPNDPEFSKQWHLSMINAATAWDTSQGSTSIPVAILDTGVDPNHPDLSSKLVSGYNFYNNNNNWSDTCGHGTKVAGAAAALTNNAVGVAGVTWDNPIIPIKITDSNCWGYYSAMIQGITYAADNGARAANISFQIFNGNALTDAAKYMYDKGGWVVAAAGNTGQFENYSDNPYIISVGATSSSDTVTSFSSYGPYVDLAAPGSAIYTTKMGGLYSYVSGTSFSSPITAGLVSLLFSADPTLTPSQVYDILKTSAVDIGAPGYDQNSGWGRINAAAAMSQISSSPPPPEPTPDPIPDTTPPSVSITNPLDGDQTSATITVDVDATDDVQVDNVELYVDNVLYQTISSSPYDFSLDTTTLTNEVHTLKAIGIDTSSNSNFDEITITISNTSTGDPTPNPSISIISPTDGSKVNGRITISVLVSDFTTLPTVNLYLDGGLLATMSNEPYEYNFHTKGLSSGPHTITSEANNLAENTASDSITVLVEEKGSDKPPNPNKGKKPNESDIQEFSSGVVVATSSTTLTKAMEFMDSVLMDLSSGSKVGPAVSQAAQLHKWFAHEDKDIKKAFQEKFKQFIKDVKAAIGVGQGAAEKASINELEKAELKINMQIEKEDKEQKTKNKIKTAIQLQYANKDLQEIRNKISIAKLNHDNNELVMLQDIERELLKNSMIFEAESNGKKLTSQEIKSIDEKAAKMVEESHNTNSGKGNSDNGKGNGKGSDKKSDKSNGNSGKSKGKKK